MPELGKSFKQTLESLIKGCDYKVYDYGCETDFQELWKPEPQIPDGHIIVVWDDRTWSEERNEKILSPHLTPMDWALAFSIKTLDSKPRGAISIHIVDLTGEDHDKKWAMQMRHQLLVEMPWVKLYAPLIPKKDGTQVRLRHGYNPIIGPASSNGDSPALLNDSLCLNPSGETLDDYAKIPDSRDRLINLAKQWGATLTQSKDHHDINNVIGPGFLGKKSRPEEGLRGAFHTRLSWCDFEIIQASIENWPPQRYGLEDKLFNKPLSLLTVDDHLMEGWGEFVCKLLAKEFESQHDCNSDFKKISKGNSKKINIYGCTGPDPLIKFLETAKFAYRDFAQQLQVPCGKNGDEISPQVILLDLRLPDLTKEKVTELLERLKCLPKPKKLAWPEIKKEEIESIKTWCYEKKTNDDRAEDKALLLLPRLLAMALPLTPIILFSATGQTWIKETLKPY